MFHLNIIDSNNIHSIFKNENEELIDKYNLNSKKWFINDNTYNLLKYDKEFLLIDLIPTVGLLRSVITNQQGELLCFSPPKSRSIDSFIKKYKANDCYCEEFVEGTMINLFFDKNKGESGDWEIATKSTVGGKVSYFTSNNTKVSGNSVNTFREMFLDACNHTNLEFNMLKKEYCYSFVLQHPDNKMVQNIRNPRLYLISVYEINNKDLTVSIIDRNEHVKTMKNENEELDLYIPDQYDSSKDYEMLQNEYASLNTDYSKVGIMFIHKESGERSKYRNPNYEQIKKLKGNHPKLQFTYLSLRREGKVRDYLKYFPESKSSFNQYRDLVHAFTNTLHTNYMTCYVFKQKQLIEFPSHFRKHMYVLHHEHYLKHLRDDKEKVTLHYVISYINNLHPAQLMFSINYPMRKQYIEKEKDDKNSLSKEE